MDTARITLSTYDLAILAAYAVAVVIVGFRSARKTHTSEDDFLLAGRRLTLPIFVMTLVSTWYGGILGVGEFTYRYGVSNWLIQGVPYYIFAALFAAFLAKKIRTSNLRTIPDKLELAYDRKTAVAGSVLTFILMTPAPYILMLAVFVEMLFGWGMPLALAAVALGSVSYLLWGGFQSDVDTDVVEFICMFIGFAVIIPFAWSHFGGFAFLQEHLPPLHLTWHGGNSAGFILVWFFIALWTLVDPAFHQRCYAAKTGTVAQRGIFISILFWLAFDAMTLTAGLYARAALPGLGEPMMAYPALAEAILPPVAKGVFYVGMLATIMSTLNTLAFVSAQTFGRDFLLRLRPGIWEGAGPNVRIRFVRIGLVVSFVASVGLALLIPSVVRLWYTIGTLAIPGLLVPLIAGYFDPLRMRKEFAFAAMVGGFSASLGWFLLGAYGGVDGGYPFGIEPMYPGLFVSVALWAAGRTRPGTLPTAAEG
jgi:SSS family solute:Na+ symporter